MTYEEKRELKKGYVDLRDHLEMLIREKQVQAELRFRAQHDALVIQTKELDKRLDSLNHAHEKAQTRDAEYVKDSEYKIKTTYYDEWCRGVDQKLTTLETRSMTWTAAIALFFVIIQIVIRFWR